MQPIEWYRQQPFSTLCELIAVNAHYRPDHIALVHEQARCTYAELDRQMNRVAASLQRDGIKSGDVVAFCASNSIAYCMALLGALRAGACVTPLAQSATAESLWAMLGDSDAKKLFLDEAVAATLPASKTGHELDLISLDESFAPTLEQWLLPDDAEPSPVVIDPDAAFDIIYSSGTTGSPKGIVHSHRMRWLWMFPRNRTPPPTDPGTHITLLSTPMYSGTTLFSFFPVMANGGTAVLMTKFDAGKFLALAEQHRVTHAMLVPVQYQRIMSHPDFDRFDLSSFQMKSCTSAPFAAQLKTDVLKRWPGGLIEYYGMTEGGGGCMLVAHEHPDKLHTVGKPSPGAILKLIDESGKEVAPGEIGEIVGRSASMMTGYHNQPEKTAAAEWHDPEGNRYIRTGDVGRFDEDGFLILLDRRKDMIISGGFNIYPSDLEAVIRKHEAVAEVAVVGVPSNIWGETPVAFVVARSPQITAAQLRDWANERLGKMQRLAAVELVESLPRSGIGKILKRELRQRYIEREQSEQGDAKI